MLSCVEVSLPPTPLEYATPELDRPLLPVWIVVSASLVFLCCGALAYVTLGVLWHVTVPGSLAALVAIVSVGVIEWRAVWRRDRTCASFIGAVAGIALLVPLLLMVIIVGTVRPQSGAFHWRGAALVAADAALGLTILFVMASHFLWGDRQMLPPSCSTSTRSREAGGE